MSDNRPETRTRARFWAEVRRRRVFRVGGLYVAGAFVILQLGEIVLPAFNAPDWALQTLVVFVFLGLPVALALSWVFDLTPEGLKRTRSLVPVGSASMMPRVALLVVTTVSLGLGAFWFSRSAMSGSDAAGPRDRTRPTAARFASRDPDAPISAIAVLPLAHFAEGDDLFARQLHDEIITRLSELTSLRVVSRTSVERYRTTDKLLPEIAAELNVQAVVTGSVAMTAESDSVRISIQLLHAPSDTHLESRTFEREMKDVLRLQTEVAMAIAATVQEEVGAEVDGGAQQVAQVDPEAYEWHEHCEGASILGLAEWARRLPPPRERSEPRGRRDGSRCGVQRLGTSRKSPLRARWTSWAASRSQGMRNDIELGMIPGFRPSAPGSDLSFS